MHTRLAIFCLLLASLVGCGEKQADTASADLPIYGRGVVQNVDPYLPWGTLQTADRPRRIWWDANTIFVDGNNKVLTNYRLTAGKSIKYAALLQQGELYLTRVVVNDP